MDELISPKLDIVFKKMFGDVNNADMLNSLISAYLNVDIGGEFNLSNSEITTEVLEQKFARLDLHITTAKSEIDIEVQVLNSRDYAERCLYYWASLYNSSILRGHNYGTAKQALTLNILDFKMFKCEDFNTNFTFYDPKNKITLSDKAQISFIELPKIRKITREQIKNDERIAWAVFFNAKTKEELDMLSETTKNVGVQKAVAVIKELSADEKIREAARKREEALFNERSIMQAEREQGRAEERAKRETEMAAISKAMRESGMTEEQINSILNGQPFKTDTQNIKPQKHIKR